MKRNAGGVAGVSFGTDPITGEGWVMKLLWGRGNGPAASVLLAVAAMVLFVLAATPARAAGESENPERRQFFPIGDHDTEVKKLKEEYIPFGTEGKGEGDIPPRPKLLIEQGDPFLAPGNLNAGFVLPGLGTIVQPRLWTYMFYRTTLQSFDNGAPGRERETEWANRLDLFFNLQLTGTEKILLGLRPVDKNQQNEFTRYTFAGADEGFNQEFNINVETFFFEGDFGSLAPVFDPAGIKPIDYGFTIGRQLITFQEGMLINDTVDAIGIVRNNIPLRGTSNFRASAMWAWNRLDRNDQFRGTNDDMFALFLAADTYVSTYNLDMIYVLDSGDGDGFYVGASAIQRLVAFDGISTAFRINSSFALEDEIPGNVIGNGALFSAEISKTLHGSDDIVYFNPFVSVGNYTQAGRETVVGGPLANLGILFASPSLSLHLSELNPFTTNGVAGAAIGYQAFWKDHTRNLIMEIAGRHDYDGSTGFDSLGLGFQYQHKVNQNVQLVFEGFYVFNESRDDGSGARAEIIFNY